MPEKTRPVIVIGAGIVGLSTAYQLLQQQRTKSVLVLEKEPEICRHQTGRNSGVLHSGIYYKPGSLKARNCRLGKLAVERFCQEHGIRFDTCGKVIVAVTNAELPILDQIYERGIANDVNCSRIGPDRLAEIEPAARGVGAIHVPETGIIDFTEVGQKLAALIRASDGSICCGEEVVCLQDDGGDVVVETTSRTVRGAIVINCAGLFSDRVVALSGRRPSVRIVPFRGEYYILKPTATHLCRHLIYPVPDPKFPFLGVHFTRMIHGGVECGPNAVLALAREGYRRRDLTLRDLWETITYSGFRRVAARYWRVGSGEMYRSLSKRAFVVALQRLIPELSAQDLDGQRAGVRAQAIAPDGTMVDDFLIERDRRIIHVCNAPSPAATSALNIGALVASQTRDLL